MDYFGNDKKSPLERIENYLSNNEKNEQGQKILKDLVDKVRVNDLVTAIRKDKREIAPNKGELYDTTAKRSGLILLYFLCGCSKKIRLRSLGKEKPTSFYKTLAPLLKLCGPEGLQFDEKVRLSCGNEEKYTSKYPSIFDLLIRTGQFELIEELIKFSNNIKYDGKRSNFFPSRAVIKIKDHMLYEAPIAFLTCESAWFYLLKKTHADFFCSWDNIEAHPDSQKRASDTLIIVCNYLVSKKFFFQKAAMGGRTEEESLLFYMAVALNKCDLVKAILESLTALENKSIQKTFKSDWTQGYMFDVRLSRSSYSAKAKSSGEFENLDKRNQCAFYPIYFAIVNRNREMVKYLLSHLPETRNCIRRDRALRAPPVRFHRGRDAKEFRKKPYNFFKPGSGLWFLSHPDVNEVKQGEQILRQLNRVREKISNSRSFFEPSLDSQKTQLIKKYALWCFTQLFAKTVLDSASPEKEKKLAADILVDVILKLSSELNVQAKVVLNEVFKGVFSKTEALFVQVTGMSKDQLEKRLLNKSNQKC